MRILICLLAVAAFQTFTASAEEVEVMYKDGKKDRGEWVDANADKVILKMKVGNNSVDLQIPWAKIEKLSNGLTRETALKKWKETHRDKLCPTCNGERQVSCQKCNGTSIIAKLMLECKSCKGTGIGECFAKGCEKGKTTCPEPCLKLSEGKWEKGDENILWRKFYYGNGRSWKSWSERHLGQIIEMQDGVPTNVGRCKACDGTMKVNCKECNGTFKGPCIVCKGAKQVPEPGPVKKCADCTGGMLTCATCKGTGLTK
jgi:hypothetical protein